MLRSTPRIEVSQRSREARLRLERMERLIVVVITRRSLLVPRTGGLAAKLMRIAKPIGSRPNRPNRSRSVTADDIEQPLRDMDSEIGVNADQVSMDRRYRWAISRSPAVLAARLHRRRYGWRRAAEPRADGRSRTVPDECRGDQRMLK
jgi:hypothetical protein